MTKTMSLPSPAAAVDYDATLILAVETSNKSWVVAAQAPGLGQVKAKQTIAPKAEALATAIEGYRRRATACGAAVERVIVVYEAGYGGFWLARWLTARGIDVHVIQPSSVPVERRKRRAKSDKIDADLLLRTLLAWLRGEPRVCSMVATPGEADEDARHPTREREELIRERIMLTNRIGAILATLGIAGCGWRRCGRRWISHCWSMPGRRLAAPLTGSSWSWCRSRRSNASATPCWRMRHPGKRSE